MRGTLAWPKQVRLDLVKRHSLGCGFLSLSKFRSRKASIQDSSKFINEWNLSRIDLPSRHNGVKEVRLVDFGKLHLSPRF